MKEAATMHASSLAHEKSSLMNVHWRMPDGSVIEQKVADVEQLMFVLRMVGGVSIDQSVYKIAGSTLVVEHDKLSVAVNLA